LGKAKYAAAALKHAHKLPKPTKKGLGIAIAIVIGLGLLLLGLFIALVIWLVNVIGSSDTTSQVIDSAQQATNQVVENQLQGVDTNPLNYIVDGTVDTSQLEQTIQSLSPQQLVLFTQQFTTEVNQLLESGQIVQEQATQLLNLLP